MRREVELAAEPSRHDIRLIITASSLGTVFEWYDFFIWGTLTTSGILQRSFFPAGDELLATLLAWATFAVGFAFRPGSRAQQEDARLIPLRDEDPQ